jgi:hypothetical protein
MFGRTLLSFVQLQTVVAQIEAILNDRALTFEKSSIRCKKTKGLMKEIIKVGDLRPVHTKGFRLAER